MSSALDSFSIWPNTEQVLIWGAANCFCDNLVFQWGIWNKKKKTRALSIRQVAINTSNCLSSAREASPPKEQREGSFRGSKPFWSHEKRERNEGGGQRERRGSLFVFLCLLGASQEALAYIELKMNARWSKGWMRKWSLLRFNAPFEHSQRFQ